MIELHSDRPNVFPRALPTALVEVEFQPGTLYPISFHVAPDTEPLRVLATVTELLRDPDPLTADPTGLPSPNDRSFLLLEFAGPDRQFQGIFAEGCSPTAIRAGLLFVKLHCEQLAMAQFFALVEAANRSQPQLLVPHRHQNGKRR